VSLGKCRFQRLIVFDISKERLHFQAEAVQYESFETSGTIYPATNHYIQ
jgi:hypothetical protein